MRLIGIDYASGVSALFNAGGTLAPTLAPGKTGDLLKAGFGAAGSITSAATGGVSSPSAPSSPSGASAPLSSYGAGNTPSTTSDPSSTSSPDAGGGKKSKGKKGKGGDAADGGDVDGPGFVARNKMLLGVLGAVAAAGGAAAFVVHRKHASK